MKATILLVCIIFSGTFVVAQNCNRILSDADLSAKNGQYHDAILKYQAAKNCDPSLNKTVDKKIIEVFDKIEGLKVQAEQALKAAEIIKGKDSIILVQNFISENSNWFETINDSDKPKLVSHVLKLNNKNEFGNLDTLSLGFDLGYWAKYYDSVSIKGFRKLNLLGLILPYNDLVSDQTSEYGGFSMFGFNLLDFDLINVWEMANLSTKLLKSVKMPLANKFIEQMMDSINIHKNFLERNFLFPDQVCPLPNKMLFDFPSTDKKYFLWGYTCTDDFRKSFIRLRSISLNDFSFSKDTTIELQDNGRFEKYLKATGNYSEYISTSVTYSMKKNRVDYETEEFSDPTKISLVSKGNNFIKDLSKYSGFYLSPDGKYASLFNSTGSFINKETQLELYDVSNNVTIPLPNSGNVVASTFSSDSKRITYLDKNSASIIMFDLYAKHFETLNLKNVGLPEIKNIDFTGNDDFLAAQSEDSIYLFSISSNRIIKSYFNKFVKNISVSPNDKYVLITYSVNFSIDKKQYTAYVSLLMGMDFKVIYKLYSDSKELFFSQDEKYIYGYNDLNISKWDIEDLEENKYKSIVRNPEELKSFSDKTKLWYFIPFDENMQSKEADLVQSNAYTLKDLADLVDDTLLSKIYYLESQQLFAKLISGDADHIRKERIPFYYDWVNWIDKKLGKKNYSEQLKKEKIAVGLFDKMLQTRDTIYPEVYNRAGNAYLLLHGIYDSINNFGKDNEDVLRKEIWLREKCKKIDSANSDNNDKLAEAYSNLAMNFILKYAMDTLKYKSQLDSVSFYCNKGLSVCRDLTDTILVNYTEITGDFVQRKMYKAKIVYDKIIHMVDSDKRKDIIEIMDKEFISEWDKLNRLGLNLNKEKLLKELHEN